MALEPPKILLPLNGLNDLNYLNVGWRDMERLELSQELGRDVLAMAKSQGASQGDVVMVESDSFFVTVRLGEVEKISHSPPSRHRPGKHLGTLPWREDRK